MTTVTDSFNRADSAVTLGNTDTGQTWTPVSGTWGISSNEAYDAVVGAGIHDSAIVPIGGSIQDVSITFSAAVVPHGSGVGMVLRYVDSNNYNFAFLFRDAGGTWPLLFAGKVVSGALTYSVASSVGTGAIAVPYVLRTVISGADQWQIYVNNSLKASGTESANNTGTSAGLLATTNQAAIFDAFNANGQGGGGAVVGPPTATSQMFIPRKDHLSDDDRINLLHIQNVFNNHTHTQV